VPAPTLACTPVTWVHEPEPYCPFGAGRCEQHDASNTTLSTVSGSSASDAWAFGNYEVHSVHLLIEHWNVIFAVAPSPGRRESPSWSRAATEEIARVDRHRVLAIR
jgi:hypothetical protein